MKRLIVKDIGLLVGIGHEGKLCLKGKEMTELNTLSNACLITEDGHFVDYGKISDYPPAFGDEEIVDIEGGTILPSWCDPCTHIVFAGSREQELVNKTHGLSYAEVAKRGGGILNSADRLHEMSEEDLYQQAMKHVDETIRKGAGCVGIKSGYGLNMEDELKILRVIRCIRETTQLKVVATFPGAYAVSCEYKGRQDAYVDLTIDEMIPAVGVKKLAEFINVFCDTGFFTPEETVHILKADAEYGMRPKIHADELELSGGVEVGVKHNVLSVDHLEGMTEEEVKILKNNKITPTAFPGTSLFLNLPFALGRKMIDRGLPLALASDYNPGSIPSGGMKFIISLACIKMRLMSVEAINAATLNGTCAMGLSKEYGSITRGRVANFFITGTIPSIEFIPYAYTIPIVK